MKKLLLGATALTLVAGGAAAQEWTARVGGFATLGIGYVDTDNHVTEVELVNNAEVIFNFRLVADNGITFGYKVEMEGSNGSVDESVGFAQGSFGRAEIGEEDGAADRLAGGAAGATAFSAAGDAAGFLFDYAAGESVGVVDTDGGDTSDDLKITYFTPKFAGFQAGASYVPGDGSGTSTNGSNDSDEALEFGVGYDNTFGDFAVDLGFGYITYLDEDNNGNGSEIGPGFSPIDGGPNVEDAFIFSANVGFGGFTVGGIYGVQQLTNDVTLPDGSTEDENGGFAVGVNYETGPWGFGAQYAQGVGAEEDVVGVSAGVDYALAPGVTTGAVVEFAENDFGVAGAEDSAFAVGAFLGLNF